MAFTRRVKKSPQIIEKHPLPSATSLRKHTLVLDHLDWLKGRTWNAPASAVTSRGGGA